MADQPLVPEASSDSESPSPKDTRRRGHRRQVLMQWLAAGAGVATLASLGSTSAQAANGDPVLAGQTVDATAPTKIRNGVSYTADATADGIQGYATGANNAGVFGRNNLTDGIGISGAAPNGTGAFGESLNGFGVGGRSTTGVGVQGSSASGYGGAFAGGMAAIRLTPSASGTGAPTTGGHQVGELYVDSAGVLYYCTVAGSPGTWLPVLLGSSGGLTNPMTAQDDLIVGGTAGAPARLAKGSNGQVLTLNNSGHVGWANPSGGAGFTIIYSHVETTDLINGLGVGASWTRFLGPISFTVGSSTSAIEFRIRGHIFFTGSGECQSRLTVDGTTHYAFGGGAYSHNVLGGSAPVMVTGLSAGSHAFTMEEYTNGGGNMYCRCTTWGGIEGLEIQILEWA